MRPRSAAIGCAFSAGGATVPELLAACDLFVNASAKNEGLAGNVREALAMARAVVFTQTDGNPEIVIDGETGLLVPPREPEPLAEPGTSITAR